MPKIRIESTAENARGFIPNTRADGAAGAAIGSALKGLGSAVGGFGEALEAKNKQKEALDDNLFLTKLRASENQRMIMLEADAAEDGTGHVDAAVDGFEGKTSSYLDSLPEGERKKNLQLKLEEMKGTLATGALSFEVTRKAGFQRAEVQDVMDETLNNIAADPSTFEDSFGDVESVIQSLGLPEKSANELRENFEQNAVRARFIGLFEGSQTPDQIDELERQLKEEDRWKEALPPATYEQLLKYAETRRGTLGKELEVKFTSGLAATTHRLDIGQDVTKKDWERLIGMAEATGKDANVDAVIAARAGAEEKATLLGATPTQTKERLKQESAGVRGAWDPAIAKGDARSFLISEEGFTKKAYWDVNAWRVGYGSDTYMTPDGKVHKVTKDTVIEREWADLDIGRREQEFKNTIIGQVGTDTFSGLPGEIRVALTSVAYNYGSLPNSVVSAVKSGDRERIATAVGKLPENPARRQREASLIRGLTPENSARLSEIQKYMDTQNKALGSDPVSYAESQNIIPVSEIVLSDPASFTERGESYITAKEFYSDADTAVEKPLKPGEMSKLKDLLDSGSVDDQMVALTGIGAMPGEAKADALKQLGETDATAAMVASMAQDDDYAARNILLGRQRVKEAGNAKEYTERLIGSEAERSEIFNSMFGDAFVANPGIAKEVMESANFLTIGSTNRSAGLDAEAYKKALLKVMGGSEPALVNEHSTVITPKGVTAQEFETFTDILTEDDFGNLALNGSPPVFLIPDPTSPQGYTTQPVPASWFDEEAIWHTESPGNYSFFDSMGNALVDSAGNRYILSVDDKAVKSVISERTSEEFIEAQKPAPRVNTNSADIDTTLDERAKGKRTER